MGTNSGQPRPHQHPARAATPTPPLDQWTTDQRTWMGIRHVPMFQYYMHTYVSALLAHTSTVQTHTLHILCRHKSCTHTTYFSLTHTHPNLNIHTLYVNGASAYIRMHPTKKLFHCALVHATINKTKLYIIHTHTTQAGKGAISYQDVTRTRAKGEAGVWDRRMTLYEDTKVTRSKSKINGHSLVPSVRSRTKIVRFKVRGGKT